MLKEANAVIAERQQEVKNSLTVNGYRSNERNGNIADF